MKKWIILIGGTAVLCVLLFTWEGQRVSREIIEPLPDGLSIAGEHDVKPGRVEGPRLCAVITHEDSAEPIVILKRLRDHLLEQKGWKLDPVDAHPTGEVISLVHPDGHAADLWFAEGYLSEWPNGECSEFLRTMHRALDRTVLLHVYL